MQKQLIKEKLRIDLREKYRHTFLGNWAGKNLSAQHRFCDSDDGSVILSFLGDPVIQSFDAGKTWDYYSGRRTWPFADQGIFRVGQLLMAIEGGREFFLSYDGGITWGPRQKIPSAGDMLFSGIGKIRRNFFTTTMTTDGQIIIAGDYSLGRPEIDGDAICTISSGNWGESWEFSRLFTPAEPLPKAPEGFGEPVVVETPNRELWMVFRTLYGELWQCISQDGGLTWNTPTPTGLASPISNFYAKRLPDSGATVLCWNFTKPSTWDVSQPRTNLVFSVSHDNCRTWSCPVVVEPCGGEYPTIHFMDEDMFIMYQSSPGRGKRLWAECGLTLVRYDKKEVDSLPAWTTETIQPYIDDGLVAHWLAVNCKDE